MSALLDPAHASASLFLWVTTAFFLLVFALPLLFAPLTWARWFRWPAGTRTSDHLTEYLGRCLGALAAAVLLLFARTAPRPAEHPEVFELIAAAGLLLGLVHVYGAVRRAQPWTEDAEIVLYFGVGAVAAYLRTTL